MFQKKSKQTKKKAAVLIFLAVQTGPHCPQRDASLSCARKTVPHLNWPQKSGLLTRRRAKVCEHEIVFFFLCSSNDQRNKGIGSKYKE